MGVTKSPPHLRKAQHFYAAKTGRKMRISSAIRKYCAESFRFGVLGIYEFYKDALEAERNFISVLVPAYNITSGGESPSRTIPVSQETRAKLSAAMRRRGPVFLGKKHTAESLARMRDAHKGALGPMRGRKHSEEYKKAISLSLLGHPGHWLGKQRSEETKAKMRAAKLGWKPPPASPLQIKTRIDNIKKSAITRRKYVECVNDGQVYCGAQEAAIKYGLNSSSISGVALGKRKALRGYVFRYVYGKLQ